MLAKSLRSLEIFATRPWVSVISRWTSASRLSLVSAAAMGVAALGPFAGDAVSFHYPQLAVVALLAVGFWRGTASAPIEPRAWKWLLFASFVWLQVIGLSRFFGFWVNGVDFSVFDWMLESTHHGRFGYSPIFDVNHFGVHSSFILLLWVPLHELVSSPLWLTVSAGLVVWLGVFPVRRLVRLANGGPHGTLELLGVLWWVGNAWVGKALHAGFRPELVIPFLTAWFLIGWIERNSELTFLSLLALLCTKEDTGLYIVGFVLAAVAVERWRWRQALTIAAVSLGWLAIYVLALQPRLTGTVHAGYWGFWSDFGDSPRTVITGMVNHPVLLAEKLITSRWWAFFLPLLLVPVRSLRATGGLLPSVLLLGAASYSPMHEFNLYYPLPLLAFALFGVLDVWSTWKTKAGRWREGVVLASLAFSSVVGTNYPRAASVDLERHERLQAAWKSIEAARVVCVQPVLFPHLGYSRRLVPILDEGCLDLPGAVALVNVELDSSPTDTFVFAEWVKTWRNSMPAHDFGRGFVVLGPRPR